MENKSRISVRKKSKCNVGACSGVGGCLLLVRLSTYPFKSNAKSSPRVGGS